MFRCEVAVEFLERVSAVGLCPPFDRFRIGRFRGLCNHDDGFTYDKAREDTDSELADKVGGASIGGTLGAKADGGEELVDFFSREADAVIGEDDRRRFAFTGVAFDEDLAVEFRFERAVRAVMASTAFCSSSRTYTSGPL